MAATSILLALLGLSGLVSGQYSSIYTDNGLEWRGEWGFNDYCPSSSYAYALDFKFETLDKLDNTGGNSVKLYCLTETGNIMGYINSLEGQYGDWQGIRSCPTGQYLHGFHLRVFPEQGTFGDDFGVDNIQVECTDGTVLDGMDGVNPPPSQAEHIQEDSEEVNRKWVEVEGMRMEEVRVSVKDSTRIHGNWGTWATAAPV